jgi:DNA-binding NarL/FixJ family response regulator
VPSWPAAVGKVFWNLIIYNPSRSIHSTPEIGPSPFKSIGDLAETMDSQPRIFVICDNRLLRESLVRILAKKTDFEVASWSALDGSILSEIRESGVNLLVCDSLQFVLGESKLIDTSQRIDRRIRPILVAMEDNPEDFLAAIRSGVLGYVLKDASAAEVVNAIRAVAAGEAACPARLTKVLFDSVASQLADSTVFPARDSAHLTRREQQLIPLINRGLTNKEIASELKVSEQTIKSHVHRILHKVGVEDRQSLSRIGGCG